MPNKRGGDDVMRSDDVHERWNARLSRVRRRRRRLQSSEELLLARHQAASYEHHPVERPLTDPTRWTLGYLVHLSHRLEHAPPVGQRLRLRLRLGVAQHIHGLAEFPVVPHAVGGDDEASSARRSATADAGRRLALTDDDAAVAAAPDTASAVLIRCWVSMACCLGGALWVSPLRK